MGQVIPFPFLPKLSEDLHRAGKRIVLTNGHFDLLHIGHVRYLQAARSLGDVLIVAVNDDVSTRRRKGRARPLVPEAERAELLAALACVDYVTIFPGETAEEVVRLVRPHVYVKGGDYGTTEEDAAAGKQPLPEAPVVRALGGEVVLIPLVPERSTSALVRRILAAYGCEPEAGAGTSGETG
ncbi:adenylyltransferase/cytidyltransferase family protein [Thermomicrobium roseum]|uniref:Aut protein n=1 Tax=Thermomicrobium roseum (strain ATCC 27502 / DSM 5159 / P-2) TaxID=309801 RepID=B9L1U2_THERP|nr:adenylyltransferase/cytidyltransferase family protein [Thermomicrobium roseum]ACM05972.1 aut protein [Thermomicrobium roseum DSM 5159]